MNYYNTKTQKKPKPKNKKTYKNPKKTQTKKCSKFLNIVFVLCQKNT